MAFKRTQSPTFTTPVTVNVPNDKGSFDKNTFNARFRRCPTDEVTQMRSMGNEDVVRRTLVGWDLKDEETQEDVPFSAGEMEAILQIQPSPLAIAQAFFEANNGARSKN